MKKKLSYDNKRFYRKTIISQEEHDKIIDEGTAAWKLLHEDEFEFAKQLLSSAKDYAQNSILNNTITDAAEEVTISESVKKIFSRPKKDQVDELVGQYKIVSKYFEDLQERVDIKESMEAGIANDTIVIQND